jgi:phosphonate transport system ATP-binding protein
VIELLGVGVTASGGGWLLHRACARLYPGYLTMVLGRSPAERRALLDAVSARRVPDEGRVWVSRVPLMRETRARVRRLVADVDLGYRPVARRSIFWNALATWQPGLGALAGLLQFPRRSRRLAALRALEAAGLEAHASAGTLLGEGCARLAVARALLHRPDYLVLRDVDVALGIADAGRFFTMLRGLVRAERRSVLASVASPELARAFGDRVIVLSDGLLVFHGPASDLGAEALAGRFRVPTGAPM